MDGIVEEGFEGRGVIGGVDEVEAEGARDAVGGYVAEVGEGIGDAFADEFAGAGGDEAAGLVGAEGFFDDGGADAWDLVAEFSGDVLIATDEDGWDTVMAGEGGGH